MAINTRGQGSYLGI